ncbi:MAG: cytochrome c family protein [Desulfotignum sp.]|nr:cytochrome c family protein [Desulfotignum sp.]
MSRQKYGQCLLAAAVLLLLFSFAALSGAGAMNDPDEKRPDILTIGSRSPAADRQMPLVQFLHDRHTRAVDGKCIECHDQTAQNTPGFTFKEIEDADITARMELFHNNCIACHEQMKAKGSTGPMEAACRFCHNANFPIGSSRKDLAFDRSLHFRHVSSDAIVSTVSRTEDNCSACHHSFNEASEEIFYEQGKESACIYCHKAEPAVLNDLSGDKPQTIRPARQAAHDSCVVCHLALTEKKIKTGPVECSGCHDAAEQAKIRTLEDVPRLKRNQPDIALITGWESLGDDQEENAKLIAAHMDPVAFDHKLHETQNPGCTSCHHENLDACITCHTAAGDKKGGYVKLADAMHRMDSTFSCIGCHTEHKQSENCAGCHARMPEKSMKDQDCASCHTVDAKARPQNVLKDPESASGLAAAVLETRAASYEKVPMDKVPDIVTIGVISKEYHPGRFPHRMVVKAVFEKADKSKMARSFHGQELTLCAGCHHNSPPSMTPPKCGSCHGNTPDIAADKPGLMGAYHGQCITCHQEMAVASVLPTDCIKCHEKK